MTTNAIKIVNKIRYRVGTFLKVYEYGPDFFFLYQWLWLDIGDNCADRKYTYSEIPTGSKEPGNKSGLFI